MSGPVPAPKPKNAKSHRQAKDYAFDADTFATDFPALADPADAKDPAHKLAAHLSKWMRDMKAWGEDVRDDIVRLETAARVAPGDPGDPPPAPRAK